MASASILSQSTIQVDFLIVRAPSTYDAILSQLDLYVLQAIISTYHLKMKFSTIYGVGEIRRDQDLACHCYNIAL